MIGTAIAHEGTRLADPSRKAQTSIQTYSMLQLFVKAETINFLHRHKFRPCYHFILTIVIFLTLVFFQSENINFICSEITRVDIL